MHLGKRGKTIKEIQNDFADGILLIQLLEIIAGESAGKYNTNPVLKIQKIENLNKALNFVKQHKVVIRGVSSEEITDGNLKLILGMVWTIILRFSIADISEEELNAKEALLLWCKKKTTGYNGVSVDNFTTSWQDGLALCALIHAHRPDLIPFSSLDSSDRAKNLQLAFDVAERDLGIPPLLDVDDIVNVPKPDERSVMTYISQFYHHFAKNRKQETAGRRIGRLVELNIAESELKANYETRAKAHLAWVKDTTSELSIYEFDNTLPGVVQLISEFSNFKSNEKPPKIAERLAIENIFNSLQIKLNASNKAAYSPPDGVTLQDISQSWKALEFSQQERENLLLEELARQQRLDLLKKKFNVRASKMEDWIASANDFTSRQIDDDSLFVNLSKLLLYISEHEKNKPRIVEILSLRDDIVNERDTDSAAISKRADKIAEDYEKLVFEINKKKEDVESRITYLNEIEQLKKKFSNAAKEYNYWVKENIIDISSTVFPDSLETLEATKPKIDEADSLISKDNNSKRDYLDQLWKEEQEKGILVNQYSVFTISDIHSLHQQLNESTANRQKTYLLELEKQKVNDELRKKFATLAQSLVDQIERRKDQISSLAGEPISLTNEIKRIYDGGKLEIIKLGELFELQEELGGRGVTSNRYTKYTIASLKVLISQFVRFIRGIISRLAEEESLTQKYKQNAENLILWISEQTFSLQNDLEFDGTFDGIKLIKREWKEYKTTVKAEKMVEKIHLRTLLDKINNFLAGNNRSSFTPTEKYELSNINNQWNKLEDLEKEREKSINNELSIQHQLAALVKSFNNEVDELNSWITHLQSSLYSANANDSQSEEEKVIDKINTLDQARIKIAHLRVIEEDFTSILARFDALKLHSEQIVELKYQKHGEITDKLNRLKVNSQHLHKLSSIKRSHLEKSLSYQQNKQDVCLEFADSTAEYSKFVKNIEAKLDDFNFGTTLEDVEEFKPHLLAEDEKILLQNTSFIGKITDLIDRINDFENIEKKYLQSGNDIEALQESLTNAIRRRRIAYQQEMERQDQFNQYRQLFAEKANSFVKFIEEKRSVINHLDKSLPLDEKTEKIHSIYQNGAENQELIDELEHLHTSLQSRGIFTNQFTIYNLHSLQKLNKSYNDGVKNLIQFIEDDLQFERRGQEQNERQQQKEQIEKWKLLYIKQSGDLILKFDNVNEFLTDPLNVKSMDQLQQIIDRYRTERKVVEDNEEELNYLLSVAESLRNKDVDISPLLSNKFDEVCKNLGVFKSLIEEHWQKQATYDNLKQQLDEKLHSLDSFLLLREKQVKDSNGTLEEQLSTLNDLNFLEGRELYGDLLREYSSLNDHSLIDKLRAMKVRLEESESSLKARQSLLEKEILSKIHSQATPEQIEEFKEVFKHFDKNNSNKLSKLEFKSCLQSLGEDPTDEDMEKLIQKIGTKLEEGKRAVEFNAFLDYMINVTSDVMTNSEILQAFKDLAHDKEFITEADLQRGGISADRVAYLIANMKPYPGVPGGFDYVHWASDAFNR